MRSFSKFIKEGRWSHTSDQSRATDNGINTSDVQNPRVYKTLNAYVGAIANMEYIIPEQALEKLRSALDRVGYSFWCNTRDDRTKWFFDLPLTRFGGRFGKDTDTPHDEVINDDGISHMVEGGLALKIQYEMMRNNSCRIFAKIE